MSQPPVVVGVDRAPSSASAGSVEVAATADPPVEAVPPEASPGRLQRVVVGIDGAAASVRVLHRAPERAREQQARAVLGSTLDDGPGAPVVTTVEPVVVREQPAPRLLAVVGPGDLLVLGDRGRGAP